MLVEWLLAIRPPYLRPSLFELEQHDANQYLAEAVIRLLLLQAVNESFPEQVFLVTKSPEHLRFHLGIYEPVQPCAAKVGNIGLTKNFGLILAKARGLDRFGG